MLDPNSDDFKALFLPQFLMAVYGFVIVIMLSGLSIYHWALVASNETTQEEMRDKYAKWGGNPYNKGSWSKQNWQYFVNQQESLIYGNENQKEPMINQHILDSALLQAVEIDDQQSQSVMSNYPHGQLVDDIKSVKSMGVKSRGSIKSEVHIISIKNEDGYNQTQIIQRPGMGGLQSNNQSLEQDSEDEESENIQHSSRHPVHNADIASQKSFKSYKSHKIATDKRNHDGRKDSSLIAVPAANGTINMEPIDSARDSGGIKIPRAFSKQSSR